MPNHHILAQFILNISELSSAPTDLWTTLAARCITSEDQNTSLAVVIALINHTTMSVTTESAGVSISKSQQTTTSADLARCGMDHLGIVSNIELPDSSESLTSTVPIGVVGLAEELFPQWTQSQHAQYWISNNQTKTIAACVPLKGSYNKAFNSSIALIAIAKSELSIHDQTHSQTRYIMDPCEFAAVTAAMAHKATNSITRQSNGSILWLTQREHTILNHLIAGLSVRAIAELIKRSPHTVHDHVKNLHRKLGASSRGQLIAIATGHQTNSPHTRLQEPRILPSLLQSTHQTDSAHESNQIPQLASQKEHAQHTLALTKKMTPYQPSSANPKQHLSMDKPSRVATAALNYQQIDPKPKPERLKATPLNHPETSYPRSSY